METLDLYPLSFEEFALAVEGEGFLASLQNPNPTLIQAFKSRAIALLKTYYFVGGMPEAVSAFLDSRNYDDARVVQKRILADYERNFSKHIAPREAKRVFAVWGSVVAHLSQENKKFIFGRLAKGAPRKGIRERPHVAEASRPYLPGAARIQTRHPPQGLSRSERF